MNIESEIEAIMGDAGWATSVSRHGEPLPFARLEGAYWIVNGRPNGVDDHVGVAGPGAEYHDPVALAYALVDRAKSLQRAQAALVATAALSVVAPVVVEPVIVEPVEAIAEPVPTVDLAAENEALRRRIAELEAMEAPLLPAPDALMSDYGPVGEGYDDVTGDMLLDAFEQDEAEAVAVIQVLSATRQRHLSEQLNVEKARLRREHMLTDQANPREASIDRLLGLLTRRGD
jgi:hypothetical protein